MHIAKLQCSVFKVEEERAAHLIVAEQLDALGSQRRQFGRVERGRGAVIAGRSHERRLRHSAEREQNLLVDVLDDLSNLQHVHRRQAVVPVCDDRIRLRVL